MISAQAAKIQVEIGAKMPREVVLLDEEYDRLPFDRIECSDLCLFGHAWLGMPREAGEPLPRWRCFRRQDFRSVLPKICILKVEDWQQDRLEFSLYGGHPADYIGGGRQISLQELRHDPERCGNYIDIRNRAGRAIEKCAPQYVKKTLSWDDRAFVEYEVLMLPFLAENGVQRILQPVSARIR